MCPSGACIFRCLCEKTVVENLPMSAFVLNAFPSQIVGLCSQHTQEMTSELEFTSLKKVTNLSEYLEADRLHLSREITVVMMAPVGTSNAEATTDSSGSGTAIPVLACGSCKAPSQDQQRDIFRQVCQCSMGRLLPCIFMSRFCGYYV